MAKAYDHRRLRPAERAGRCQALLDDGRQCRRKAVYSESFHGDPEQVFDEPMRWVVVHVCGHHSREAKK